jgi:hypothetical protein
MPPEVPPAQIILNLHALLMVVV